jgi:hypothetical protein
MAEPLLVPLELSTPLVARVATMSERLADLLAALGADDPTLASIERFLRTMAVEATDTGPVVGAQPLDRVAAALGLAPVEVDLVVLAGLVEEHEGYSAAFRRVNPLGEPYPTVGLAAQLLCVDGVERARLRDLLECGAAVASGVIAVEGAGPFPERALRVGERLWPALHGIDVWPAALRRPAAAGGPDGLEEWLESAPATRAATALERRAPVTVLVTADSERVAVGRALALAGAAAAPLEADAWTTELLRLAGVHALARDRVPILVVPRPDGPTTAAAPDPGDHPGPVVVCARTGVFAPRGTRPVLAVHAEPLSARALRRLWSAALPELADAAPALAARHTVEPSDAAEAAADARAVSALDGRRVRVADVAPSIGVRAGLSLSAGVKLVRPTAGWEQLVLGADRELQLREALARLRHQSVVLDEWGFLAGRPGARGVRMLFAGPPGTGKTLSAEVLAGALGADLLVVDVSRVVSKWIGETEKNLAEVFDAAERAQAVLFFDEADALFGRRTEVSDAHDRYANLETAYLLSRLERFEGLAVLATNLRQNIDPAFTRRLEFAVDYEEPSAAEREALWRCHLPERAPLAGDVDLAQLARLYPVVGGVIRNAATAAAFLAAAEGCEISRRHLVAAIRREYGKSGRAFPGSPTDRSPTDNTPAGRTDG